VGICTAARVGTHLHQLEDSRSRDGHGWSRGGDLNRCSWPSGCGSCNHGYDHGRVVRLAEAERPSEESFP
jgi:hypothetical protein